MTQDAPLDQKALEVAIEIIDRHQYFYERQPAIWNAFVKLRAEFDALSRRVPASGEWRLVPAEITAEMAHALESNFAECLPPSEVHRANWADAYRAMLAAASPAPEGKAEPVAWRTMDSAPKDGTRVILDWDGKARVGYYLDNSKTSHPWQGWKVPSMEEWPARAPERWMPFPSVQP